MHTNDIVALSTRSNYYTDLRRQLSALSQYSARKKKHASMLNVVTMKISQCYERTDEIPKIRLSMYDLVSQKDKKNTFVTRAKRFSKNTPDKKFSPLPPGLCFLQQQIDAFVPRHSPLPQTHNFGFMYITTVLSNKRKIKFKMSWGGTDHRPATKWTRAKRCMQRLIYKLPNYLVTIFRAE